MDDLPGASDSLIATFRFDMENTDSTADVHQEEWIVHIEFQWMFIGVLSILRFFIVETFVGIQFTQIRQSFDQRIKFITFAPTQF